MAVETLSQITRAEQDALAAAMKAAQAAEAAKARADAARKAAEDARALGYKRYLELLTSEYPEARDQATTAVGESRQSLEDAVRGSGDVFACYLRWVDASVAAWAVDSELAQIKDYHGVPVRSTDPPVFRFDVDISMIVDGIAAGFQDSALRRITERRADYVNGKVSQ
jgi:membrane-bound inhibitor of C-type lysozyme